MASAAEIGIPLTVQDYIVLPLYCPGVPSFPRPTTHYLYLRHNVPKVPTPETPKEVFLVNIPTDTTLSHVKSLFAEQLDGAARVERVDFENVTSHSAHSAAAPASSTFAGKKRKRGRGGTSTVGEDMIHLPDVWDRELHAGGCTAIVTFVDAASADLALRMASKAAKSHRRVVWAQGLSSTVPALGSARYKAHDRLRYPDRHILQTNVDSFMTVFSEAEARRRQALARLRQEPDEDGFITVTRGGRTAPAHQASNDAALEKQKAKSKGSDDFYRFQQREKLKEQANDLIKGFEDDRRKVQEMKAKRHKFRPQA